MEEREEENRKEKKKGKRQGKKRRIENRVLQTINIVLEGSKKRNGKKKIWKKDFRKE